MNTDDPANLTKDDAAKYLGVSTGTINRWVMLRKIPFLKIGVLVRFRASDLARFVESKMVHDEAAKPKLRAPRRVSILPSEIDDLAPYNGEDYN